MLSRVVISAFFILHLTAIGAAAQAQDGVRLDTPSGYPVPRFVSVKDNETNCRTGPSFSHPVRYVFKRAGAPVLVVAESIDHWRKLRDPEGDECWMHQTRLRAQTHVLAINPVELFSDPDRDARVSGRIGAGVLARLIRRKGGWALVSAGAAKGWVETRLVWGGDPLSPPDRRN
jgi:SH3-like domain-containing protein